MLDELLVAQIWPFHCRRLRKIERRRRRGCGRAQGGLKGGIRERIFSLYLVNNCLVTFQAFERNLKGCWQGGRVRVAWKQGGLAKGSVTTLATLTTLAKGPEEGGFRVSLVCSASHLGVKSIKQSGDVTILPLLSGPQSWWGLEEWNISSLSLSPPQAPTPRTG